MDAKEICTYCHAAGCATCGGNGWMAAHHDEKLGRTYPLCLCCYQSPAPADSTDAR